MKPSPARPLMQAAAFVRKEIADVVHQPRLLLTLVVGPFLLLAAFGAGYRDEARPMRTIFVVAADSPIRDQLEQYQEHLGSFVDNAGVTDDEVAARVALGEGDVDLVVVFPDDPLGEVADGRSAEVRVIHTRLDPIERTAISFASDIAIGEINSEVLAAIVSEGQSLAAPATDLVEAGHAAVATLRSAVDGGTDADVQRAIDDLDAVVSDLRVTARAASSVVDHLGDRDASTDAPADASADGAADGGTSEMVAAVDDLESVLDDVRADPGRVSVERLDDLDTRLDEAATRLDQFAGADPDVLVRPLTADVELAVDGVDGVDDWYAPAAVVLVLQQFGIAFGSLTFVRERQLGITDLFRVAPLGAAATVAGKLIALVVTGTIVGAALMAGVVTALDVPLSGGLLDAASVIVLVLVASVGLGFVISLASRTDTQAVQYTMLVLLASLFFSGFFLNADQLRGPAQAIGWSLPATYGIRLLRDAMLRGVDLDPQVVAALAGYGAVVVVLAVLGARRRLGVIRR